MSDFLKQFEKGNYNNSSVSGEPALRAAAEAEPLTPSEHTVETAPMRPLAVMTPTERALAAVERAANPASSLSAERTATAERTAAAERTASQAPVTPVTRSERNTTPTTIPATPATRRHQAAIQGPSHETVIDHSYHRNRRLKIIVFALIALAVCSSGIFIFYLMNQISVKALVGVDLNEARNWALKNRIEFNITYEFSVENGKDVVISQSPEAGSKLQKGSVMDISVSKGPDPDEILRLPDFATLSISEAREWISKNKANNTNVIQEYNATVEAGRFIRMEFRDNWVSESNYSRKDILVLYYSRGAEPILKDVTVPDLRGRTKGEVDAWAATNNIKVTYEEEASESVPRSAVISQSIAAGTRISKGDAITVVLSLGAGVKVPNFNRINMYEAVSAVPGLLVTVTTKYHATVPYGSVIYQSEAAGTVLYENNPKVTVIYSEGRPFIDNLIGRSEKDLPQYFYAFQSKGADITYAVTYVDSYKPKGTVVYASKNSEFVDMRTTVWIEISLGNLLPPVDPPETPNPPDNPGTPDNPDPPDATGP